MKKILSILLCAAMLFGMTAICASALPGGPLPGDGEPFSTAGVTRVMKYLAGMTTPNAAELAKMDVNADGVVNNLDVTRMMRILAGIDAYVPGGTEPAGEGRMIPFTTVLQTQIFPEDRGQIGRKLIHTYAEAVELAQMLEFDNGCVSYTDPEIDFEKYSVLNITLECSGDVGLLPIEVRVADDEIIVTFASHVQPDPEMSGDLILMNYSIAVEKSDIADLPEAPRIGICIFNSYAGEDASVSG